jgi:membrane-bound ClpP family serine protease
MWRALTDRPLAKNQMIRVTGREGLILRVTPTEEEEAVS